MLIRFSVENFKSFNEKQELVMIPAKGDRKHKDHVISLGDVRLLRNATIYGANASGKSNTIEAMQFAKFVITKKIPLDAKNMYCRVLSENQAKDTKFEFEFHKNNNYYAYGFSLNMHEQIIRSEWLYELLSDKSQKMLFEREVDIKRIELGDSLVLSDNDKNRFQTYKVDFGDNSSGLFLTEMNRKKKLDEASKLTFFRDVYDWFDEDLIPVFPDQPITFFEFIYDDIGIKKINEIISIFDTGISKVKIAEVSMSDFKKSLTSDDAETILKTFQENAKNSSNEKNMMSLRGRTAFYNLSGRKGEEPKITTIMLEHDNAYSEFEFSEESDGTRRLFDLLAILMSSESNKVYVIDELERSLHPKLTYRFLELYFEILKNSHTQLIFTTHESTIMDQEILRRDEIWFVERNKDNFSQLYSLDRFNERYDKKLSKAYLDGRYGAIPIFKEYSYKDNESE
jgi:uncharacterized protein